MFSLITGKFKIRVNYYSNAFDLVIFLEYRNSLTIDISKMPGQNFLSKVMICLKNRTNAIHIDPILNRPQTIIINIYQSFLICAHRFVAYIKEAFVTSKINHDYLLFVIQEAINFQVSLLKSRLASLKIPFSTLFRKVDIFWIGFSAFSDVLKRRQPKFDEIVQKLYILKTKLRCEFGKDAFIANLNSDILTVFGSENNGESGTTTT
jgi:telomerase reverse transcriptase